ncbi:hypothetical protein MTBBW1_80096 [Desulfamplus magnetovallimortis]|uniref:Uncharacterized protein n=1 Tax=Desulfamplus magnetovallimortis TaxID=1246637 RepID=L0R491_9BACT|nr:hypothetical protein DEMABW1_80096 [Desulfamplus magnetovallimortis BW-1]SLM32755.1 hypothetical protein MTBBW1_80096 [Desulfamplus magnetovallimortis]
MPIIIFNRKALKALKALRLIIQFLRKVGGVKRNLLIAMWQRSIIIDTLWHNVVG